MGFPIRTSPDQSLLSDSPGLIAAGRVLHRLPAPRHPLHALSNLTIKFSQDKKNAAKFDCQRTGKCIIIPQPGGGFRAKMFAEREIEWSWPGSNRRPPACKTGALPTELQPRREIPLAGRRMVGLSGFEPLTSRLSGGRSNQLSYRPTPRPNPELVRERSLTSEHKKKRSDQDVFLFCRNLLKGGDPAARSRTATLLRLHPNHRPYLRHLPPCG